MNAPPTVRLHGIQGQPGSVTRSYTHLDRAYSLRPERDLLNAEFRIGHFECTAQINEITISRGWSIVRSLAVPGDVQTPVGCSVEHPTQILSVEGGFGPEDWRSSAADAAPRKGRTKMRGTNHS